MPGLTLSPPVSAVEPVTEMLHGVAVSDPYRWLEEQNSPRTRAWIAEQTRYARAYLDNIPGREQIEKRIREFLAVETYDSLQKAGGRYFFRKRLADQEQACIYVREAPDGRDQLLVDPSALGQGIHTAVKPLRASADGKLLLYEIKQGGERTGTFAIVDTQSCKTLPDILPRGYLRGFAFAPDAKSFVYVHEALDSERPFYRSAQRHILGTDFSEDREIFFAGEDPSLRLGLIADGKRIGFITSRFGKETRTSFHLIPFEGEGPAECVLEDADYSFVPVLANDRILALTNRDAPNFRIVELRLRSGEMPEWTQVIGEADARIHQWLVSGERIFVSYIRGSRTRVLLFDLAGRQLRVVAGSSVKTIRLAAGSQGSDEAFFETESFTEPIAITRYSALSGERSVWSRRNIPFDSAKFAHTRAWFRSKDGTSIPIFLAGRREILAENQQPVIMTSYGGYGVPMTPQFSVFVAFLMERGCLFALPQIRGGSDFGAAWHEAAKRCKRQTAYDDFLCAAEWLIQTGRTSAEKLAIFGGSNSGLLVAATMTQRPEFFRAVVCMVPMLDMLRYHLFDGAHVWQEEFGTAEDPKDFQALGAYSPYHQVRDAVRYPAVLMVSGDADRNCNPLHARKMTARLQAASRSERPIVLDYSPFRGHSPVLPLSQRVEALTDRMAFLCDQLGLGV
ncbi:MAG TPA: prolyl oligopeptidase family serine peptidase [Candidatus Acidoferrales bacterium]|nr:prolyl oligopeptidase family serine peptidase [Candidatus Acidoferrales bacterium]